MHPLITTNSKEWHQFVKHIQSSIPVIMSNQGILESDIDVAMQIFKNHVDEKLLFLFEKAASDISSYAYFYNVKPTDGIFDEYKGIYFTGITISEYFSGLGLVDLSKIISIATIMLLDARLEDIEARREVLTTRLIDTIRHGRVQDHLGKYGLYLIYKCLSNAVVEDRAKLQSIQIA